MVRVVFLFFYIFEQLVPRDLGNLTHNGDDRLRRAARSELGRLPPTQDNVHALPGVELMLCRFYFALNSEPQALASAGCSAVLKWCALTCSTSPSRSQVVCVLQSYRCV